MKRKMRKSGRNDILRNINKRNDRICDECGKIHLSKTELKVHMKSCLEQADID